MPKSFGMNRTRAFGKRMVRAKTTHITPIKGIFARVMLKTSVWHKGAVMKSAAPTGGVCCPIPQHKTTTIP